MKLFINNILWINPGDNETGNRLSFRITNGILVGFGSDLIPDPSELFVDGSGYFCSPGWIDLVCKSGAPGNPQNESMESLAKAAAAGGFTKIMLQPDTKPILQTIESVAYFKNYKSINGIELLVSAAATKDLGGQKMSEMLRLAKQGADSFSTVKTISNAGFFGRILQYLQHCGKVLFDQPSEDSLSRNAQMHEGEVSERRGLSGAPIEAELLVTDRDITLLKYAGGKLHLACLSSSEAVEKVSEAQKNGLSISCSIAANQLAFTHENLDQFDTVHKVWPPYRTEENRLELVKCLQEGKIDAVVSNHTPLHYDFKDIEFENASFGISALETTFSALVHFGKLKDPEAIVKLLYTNPAQIIDKSKVDLKSGMVADFTIFSLGVISTFLKDNWQSKSSNNPFLGEELRGSVIGVVTGLGYFENPHAMITKTQ